MKILHTADIQVKNRTANLYRSTANTLKQIEEKLIETKNEIFIISGDLFEYAEPTDSERKLMYKFLSRIVNIKTLKEIIIIAGNHDLLKSKKENETNIGYNAIDTFSEIIENFENGKKIRYLNESITYVSKVSKNIEYCVYALEDNMTINFESSNPKALNIVLFHDMLKEFVDEAKLPLRKDIYNKLLSIDQFASNSLILAGDIHKKLKYVGLDGQTFYYPGSTQQHTHNEGDFIKISDSIKVIKIGEEKSLNLFEIEDAEILNDIVVDEIPVKFVPLQNTTQYITILLDHKTPVSTILEQLKKLKLNYGTYQTFVKFKSSNVFISNELEITEAIQNLNEQKIRVVFEYDKISDAISNTINNKTIQNIIEEKNVELHENNDQLDNIDITDIKLTPDLIDDLLLSTEQLNKLFKSVMDLQLNKISDDDIPNNDLSEEILSLFETELNKVVTATKRYDIKLLSVETTGFMGILESFIDLNVPGLTKILGTNGSGKTTLFRMIRWCISGEIFENMSKASVSKNNLLIFNKKDIEKDTVLVKINALVNGRLVVFTRNIVRKWKNNTTSENKQSINWKDFISTVDREFSLFVYEETEIDDTKCSKYQGDVAEKAIATWFGDTLNNIVFITHPKLESFLRKPSEKLNELILNFIGIDYLKNLEDNLDSVKTELASTKPKKSKDDLLMEITDAKIFVKQCNEKIAELNLKNEEVSIKRDNIEKLKNSFNEELINIGNIPLQIQEKSTKIEQLNEYLATFNKKEIKDKIEFVEERPIKDKANLDAYNILRNDIEIKQNQVLVDIENLRESRIILNKEFTDYIDTEIIKCDDEIVEVKRKITDQEKSINVEFIKIGDFVRNRLKQFNEKLIETQTSINETNSSIVTNKQKINENLKNLESSICPTCHRPFDDNPEEFEKHKLEIQKTNQELELKNIELLKSKEDLDKKKITINSFIVKYEGFQKLSINNDVALLSIEIIIENCKESINMIDSINRNIETFNVDLTQIIEKKQKWNFGYSVTNNDFKILEYIVNNYLTEKIDTIKANNEKTASLKIKQTAFNEQYLEISKKIQKINDDFNAELIEYQNKLDINIADNKQIDIDNDNARKHNETEQKSLNEVSQLSLDKTSLETKKLPKYVETEASYSENKKLFDTYDEEFTKFGNLISNEKINLANLENNHKLASNNYSQYLIYQKNNLIWKIYSKLIKTGFKEIVFEYYRTFLNNTLNQLLIEMNFKLFWNDDNELYMIDYSKGMVTYQPVRQSSGMETIFLGLSLVYTFHILNVKNTISHIFIDEISGPLNKGDELSYDAANYQELMVLLLNKFENKSIFIIDHQIKQLFETVVYEVVPKQKGSIYIKK